MRLGSVTLAFFRNGEELEATKYDNLLHDDPTLAPPKVEFQSFDEVPRSRAPLVITLLLVVTAALGMLGWFSAHDMPHSTARVATSARAKAASEWTPRQALVCWDHGAPFSPNS